MQPSRSFGWLSVPDFWGPTVCKNLVHNANSVTRVIIGKSWKKIYHSWLSPCICGTIICTSFLILLYLEILHIFESCMLDLLNLLRYPWKHNNLFNLMLYNCSYVVKTNFYSCKTKRLDYIRKWVGTHIAKARESIVLHHFYIIVNSDISRPTYWSNRF